MREQRSVGAESIGEFSARIPWAAHPRAWAALLLPLVPWTVAAAVGTPWFAARYGRIVDSEPWLHAPVTELVPPALLWSGATALIASFALGWGAAVHVIVEAVRGRSPGLFAALGRSAMRSPWTLAGLTAVGGVLCGPAAVAHALIESEVAAGFVGWLPGAVAMVLLTPMWLPLVGPLTGERPWSFLRTVRGRDRLVTPAELRTAVGWAVGALTVSLLAASTPTAAPWAYSAPVIIFAGVAIALSCLASAASVLSGDPLPTVPDVDSSRFRNATAVLLVPVMLVGLLAPVVLYRELLDGSPWPTLHYDSWTAPAPDEDLDNGHRVVVSPDGTRVAVANGAFLCREDECVESSWDGEVLGMLTLDEWAARLVLDTSRPAPGTVTVACSPAGSCDGGRVTLVPEEPPAGEWGNGLYNEDIASWGEATAESLAVVTVVASPDGSATTLNLFACRSADCDVYFSAVLDVLPGAAFATGGGASPVDIAFTADGLPVVTVHDPATGRLTLHTCGNGCENTVATPITAAHSEPRPYREAPERLAGAAVEIGTADVPAIVYRDTGTGAIRYVDCGDPRCTSSTEVELLAPGPGTPPAALALNARGLPQIAAIDTATGQVVLLSCADTACADVHRSVLGDQGARPGWVGTDLDGSGRLHVVWYRPGESGEGGEEGTGTVEGIVCDREGCIS